MIMEVYIFSVYFQISCSTGDRCIAVPCDPSKLHGRNTVRINYTYQTQSTIVAHDVYIALFI
jgi:hypothetical protein